MKSLANTRGIMQLGPAAATNTFLHDCRAHHDHYVHQQQQPPPHCCQEGLHGPCLASPFDPCQGDPRRSGGYGPRNSIHSECQLVPASSLPEPLSSSTFPRMHCPPSYYEGSEECVPFGPPPGRANRIPPGLIDQFERQLPLHRDGFLTLQYQRTMTEHRSDSPGKIRHLVHSVQKLFTKSHSLEGSAAKNKLHGGGGSVVKHHHHQNDQAHHGRHHGKRSKSRDRGKPRAPQAGWWSSDDNLDSESLCHGPAMPARYAEFAPPPRYQLESSHSLPEQALKASKSNEDIVKCPTCVSLQAVPEGRFVKHSSWSSLTVSQAREVYSKAAVNVEKIRDRPPTFRPEVPRKPPELAWRVSEPPPRRLPPPELPWKPPPEMSRKVTIDKSPHYLQVPKEEWNLGKEDEIPCRRMRSGSYIKAMGDEDSGGESDSPKVSPTGASRRESYLKATGQRTMSEQAADRYRSRNESYLRAVSTVSQASCVSQFETVCESVFSEMESQAMEALDLPGCFRSRSHSYLRAIQEGYANDDSVSVRSMSPPPPMTAISTIRASAGTCYQPARTSQQICHTAVTTITTFKKPPPIPPRSAKPLISVTTQSSTESAQDVYLDPGTGKRRDAGGSALQPVPRQRPGGRSDRASLGAGRPSPLQRTVLPRVEQASLGGAGAATTPGSEWGQQNYSNSSDSLDSAKALSVAMEAAAAQKHGPGEHRDKEPADVPSAAVESAPTRCLSIGIQVDGPEPAPEAEKENKILSRFQSIGIQVEEERRLGRLGRSNSVSASVQADLELEGYYVADESGSARDGAYCRGPLRRRSSETDAFMRYTRRAEMRRQENVQSDDSPPEFDPWRLPGSTTGGGWPGGPPGPAGPGEGAPARGPAPEVRMPSVGDSRSAGREPLLLLAPRVGAGRRDGTWFLKLLQAERERMESWCQQMENDAEENDLPEDILGKIRSAVGSARLLMCQKFQQFQGLCHENLSPTADPHPTSQDLAGFWDMLQLAIEDVGMKFGELQQLKVNQWKEADTEEVQEEQLPPPMSRRPSRTRSTLYRQKSAEAADRQRVEARKRLLAAKRAASMRQNSATESADSIEIYIPEAQTRL